MKETSAGRLPSWFRLRFRSTAENDRVKTLLRAGNLHTVCESARCPNRQDCYNRGTTTVMILGDVCTRNCRFCAVTHGIPLPPDPDEPRRVADLAASLGLRHVVITSVTRDDLPDGGAGFFAETIHQVRSRITATVEVLTPDFLGRTEALYRVLAAQPDVFNHNLETVRRLQAAIRPQADYTRSLDVLRRAAAWHPALLVKSGIMVGLGETDAEVREAMEDLFRVGCRALTVGQYLAPSSAHRPVERYVPPDRFEDYADWARSIGFIRVASAPLVRSSYHAAELLSRPLFQPRDET